MGYEFLHASMAGSYWTPCEVLVEGALTTKIRFWDRGEWVEIWVDTGRIQSTTPDTSPWKPIVDITPEIKKGEHFLGRYKDVLGSWQVAVCYYGQFGHCFITVPLGYGCGAYTEGPDPTGAPEIHPQEWCEIPK